MAAEPILPQADTARRLVKILVEHLGVTEDQIGPDVMLADAEDGRPNLGCDSLDVIEITMAAEEAFNIQILDEDVTPLNGANFGALVDFVHARLA